MKYPFLCALLIPGAVWADWHAPDFPLFTSSAEGVFSAEHTLEKGHAALRLYQGDRCWQPAEAIRLNQTLSLAPCQGGGAGLVSLSRRAVSGAHRYALRHTDADTFGTPPGDDETRRAPLSALEWRCADGARRGCLCRWDVGPGFLQRPDRACQARDGHLAAGGG